MALKYSYSFTEKAERDLDEALSYIANDLANPTAAAKLATSIFENIESLTAFPEAGKSVDNEYLPDKDIRRLVIDNFILYYKISESDKLVYIVRFVYSKREQGSIIKSINLD